MIAPPSGDFSVRASVHVCNHYRVLALGATTMKASKGKQHQVGSQEETRQNLLAICSQ